MDAHTTILSLEESWNYTTYIRKNIRRLLEVAIGLNPPTSGKDLPSCQPHLVSPDRLLTVANPGQPLATSTLAASGQLVACFMLSFVHYVSHFERARLQFRWMCLQLTYILAGDFGRLQVVKDGLSLLSLSCMIQA